MTSHQEGHAIAETMILRGCNFTNCNIAFSESVEGENVSRDDIDDLFEAISVDKLCKDWRDGE